MNSGIGFQALGWVRCYLKSKDRARKSGVVFSIRLMEDCKEAGKDIASGQKQVKKWCLNNINLMVPDKVGFLYALNS